MFGRHTAPETVEFDNLYLHMMKQVHILVAGASGSGKSVAVRGFLRTITLGDPGKYQMVLIDPKRVDLRPWSTLPHCIRYASEPGDMVRALQYAMSICDSRYQQMQRRGLFAWDGGHIWVVVDELADLMTTNRKEIQPLIQRLTQIGRAAGVHVICCTQCPLATVIPTAIKVNFDAILGLRTRCAQDSRNILGETGLEQLPRYGHGIYRTPEGEWCVDIPFYDDQWVLDYVKDRKRNIKWCWTIPA